MSGPLSPLNDTDTLIAVMRETDIRPAEKGGTRPARRGVESGQATLRSITPVPRAGAAPLDDGRTGRVGPGRVSDFVPQPRGSYALDAGEWFAEAIQLECESSELRRMLTVLVVWIAEREDLLAFFRAELARRWPS